MGTRPWPVPEPAAEARAKRGPPAGSRPSGRCLGALPEFYEPLGAQLRRNPSGSRLLLSLWRRSHCAHHRPLWWQSWVCRVRQCGELRRRTLSMLAPDRQPITRPSAICRGLASKRLSLLRASATCRRSAPDGQSLTQPNAACRRLYASEAPAVLRKPAPRQRLRGGCMGLRLRRAGGWMGLRHRRAGTTDAAVRSTILGSGESCRDPRWSAVHRPARDGAPP